MQGRPGGSLVNLAHQDLSGLKLPNINLQRAVLSGANLSRAVLTGADFSHADLISPLKKASLTGFHATAKHIAAKAVSPSSETMRTI